jgi:hypothetical protein
MLGFFKPAIMTVGLKNVFLFLIWNVKKASFGSFFLMA